eukprot:4278044-Lingulodinium_polyedra.AAC.1
MRLDFLGPWLGHPDQEVGFAADDATHHMRPQMGVVDGLSDEASEGGRSNLVDLIRKPVSPWGAAARLQNEAH